MATMIKYADKEMIDNALDAVGCKSEHIRAANMSFGKVVITLEFDSLPKVEFHSTIINKNDK